MNEERQTVMGEGGEVIRVKFKLDYFLEWSANKTCTKRSIIAYNYNNNNKTIIMINYCYHQGYYLNVNSAPY